MKTSRYLKPIASSEKLHGKKDLRGFNSRSDKPS
jgi:hypothetical protein